MEACQCDRCKEYFTPERGTARGSVRIIRKSPAGTICERNISMGSGGQFIDLCEACQDSFNDWWHQIEGGS